MVGCLLTRGSEPILCRLMAIRKQGPVTILLALSEWIAYPIKRGT